MVLLNSVKCLIKVQAYSFDGHIIYSSFCEIVGDLRVGIVVKHGFYNNDNENRWLNEFETTNISTVYIISIVHEI